MRTWLVLAITLGLGCASTTDRKEPAEPEDGAIQEDSSVGEDAAVGDAAVQADAASPDAAVADAGSNGEPDGGEPDAGATMCIAGDDLRTGAACPGVASGVYAVKTVLDVWWRDELGVQLIGAGRDHVTVVQKATLSGVCDDGSIGRVELQLCGLTQPPIASWITCESRQLEVPDAVWDSAKMPRLITTGTVTDFAVGGVLSLAKASGLIGISLPDKDGPWPSLEDLTHPEPEHRFLDHDGDGRLGIAMRYAKLGMTHHASGCGPDGAYPVKFRAPRVDATGACDTSTEECDRANEIDVGLRTQLAASGSIASCDEDNASIVGASSADSIGMRVAGCILNSGEECQEGHIEFVNAMLVPYNVLAEGEAPPASAMANACECPDGCSGSACPLDQTASVGPRSAMVWLGDAEASASFDCAAVRGALETAYPGTEL